MTAGHVIENASAHHSCDIALVENGQWAATKIAEYEIFDDYDIAIFRANVPGAKAIKWSFRELSMLDQVITCGYPYALELQHARLIVRAFKGEVVCTNAWPDIKGKPKIYELSFQCPRGLSGAPLLAASESETMVVAGVIFGNRMTEMTVYSEKEEIKEDGRTSEFIKVEALHLGMAIQAETIATIKSKLLGDSIGEVIREASMSA